MSEKREKKRRYNLRLQYIAHFADWLDSEPPMWMFWKWRKWKKRRPVWDNSKDAFFDNVWYYDLVDWRFDNG